MRGSDFRYLNEEHPLTIVNEQLQNGDVVPTSIAVVKRRFIRRNYLPLPDGMLLNVSQILIAPGNACDVRIKLNAVESNFESAYSEFLDHLKAGYEKQQEDYPVE